MTNATLGSAALGALLLLSAAARGASTQTSSYSAQPVVLGAGGYSLNFSVMWTSDDFPQPTASAPGRIDLVDAGGNLAGSLTGTIGGGGPVVGVQGAGAVSGAQASVAQLGAGGSPADGTLSGTWLITGLAPGAYTLRFWLFQEAQQGDPASTIWTQAMDAGGSGAVSAPEGPAPTPAPSVALAAPAAATAFVPVTLGATASAQAGGSPLASVVIEVSSDGGATWASVDSDPNPAHPVDTETMAYTFAQAGSALVRAIATDAAGRQASAQQAVDVAKADQPAISVAPPSASLTQGQAVTFTAAGGATGNYAWAGSASGSGASQTVTFPSSGTFTVSVIDSGSADYNPSPPAAATVTVQAAFYTLSVAATAGGTATGGGTYPSGALATAVASPGPGNGFTGWTGGAAGQAETLTIRMASNLSVTATFAPLMGQTITCTPPGPVSTRSPAFALVATSSSGLPVALALDSGPVSLAGNVITPTGAPGTAVLTATQAGDALYLPAAPVVVSFPVGAAPAGVLLSDDAPATKLNERDTPVTSLRSGPAQ